MYQHIASHGGNRYQSTVTRTRADVDGIDCTELYFVRQALDTKYYDIVVENLALGGVAARKHVDIIAHVLGGLIGWHHGRTRRGAA